MATNDIGRVTPIWRGFYSAATTYELNDIVIDTAGSVWWHKSEEQTTGVIPEAGEIWDAVIDMSVFSALIQAAITTAQTAVQAAQEAESEVAEDVRRAETASQSAEASAEAASESAASVGALAQAAEQSKTEAQTAATQAAASASSAGASATSAGSSAQTAEAAKTAAQTAATQAAGSAETASGAAAVVEQKKAEALAAIQAKGEDVLESIPEDYTELSGDVGDLQTQINSTIIQNVNIFNKQNATIGHYISGNSILDDANTFYTDYIPVKNGDVVRFTKQTGMANGVTRSAYLYDVNKTRIGSYAPTDSGEVSAYTITSDSAAYIRLNGNINKINSTMLVINNDFPNYYVPFGAPVLKNYIILTEAQIEQLNALYGIDINGIKNELHSAIIPYINIFDSQNATQGYYINADSILENENTFYTDYIPVKNGDVVRFTKQTGMGDGVNRKAYLYDANKTRIGAYDPTDSGEVSAYTITSDSAAYIRLNGNINKINSTMLVINNDFPNYYVPFGAPVLKNYIGLTDLQTEQVIELVKDKEKSKFDGKKLICFGDSITAMGYTEIILNSTGITAENVGLSSGRYANSNSVIRNKFAFHQIAYAINSGDWTIPDSLNGETGYEAVYQNIQKIKNTDFESIDFASIAYGTNDFSSATTLDNPSDKYDVDTFKGAIRYSIKMISEKYPHIKIIGVTPCYRFWPENGVILDDCDTHTIGGNLLSDYVNAVLEVYTELHLPVINNLSGGINAFNCLEYFGIEDGLHPNTKGREIIGSRIGDGLLSNY